MRMEPAGRIALAALFPIRAPIIGFQLPGPRPGFAVATGAARR